VAELELALAALGFGVGWKTRRREAAWLLAVILSFSLGYAIFYGKLRYRIPILPIVLAFAGLGAATLLVWLNRAGLLNPRKAAKAPSQR